jgi:hypothetical protein
VVPWIVPADGRSSRGIEDVISYMYNYVQIWEREESEGVRVREREGEREGERERERETCEVGTSCCRPVSCR